MTSENVLNIKCEYSRESADLGGMMGGLVGIPLQLLLSSSVLNEACDELIDDSEEMSAPLSELQ